MASCAAGDIIELAPGRYPTELFIDKPLVLRGAPEPGATVLAGAGRSCVVAIEGSDIEVHLEGLTITGGRERTGAGIQLGGSVRLQALRCLFEGNEAEAAGGAIWAAWGQVRLLGCRFAGNRAPLGGAAVFTDAVIAYLDGCEFDGNRATTGACLAISGQSIVRAVRTRFAASNACAEREIEPWGGDVVFSAGNERHRPEIVFEECDLGEGTSDRRVWARPELPGDLRLVRCVAPSSVGRVPGVVVA